MTGGRKGQPLPVVGPGGRAAPPHSPLRMLTPSLALAAVYGLALLAWGVAGEHLPGGRWLAVHLFTLGVLTNVILAFSEHFGRTVTRTPGERAAWWPVVTNVGIVLVLVGLPTRQAALIVAGASVVALSVAASAHRLRTMRRRSVGARFAWVARSYEHAHGAFLVGAVLGGWLGAGALSGAWYGGVRLAHLHANVLGWGGLTLLATLVFLGPTMVGASVEPATSARAARALPRGAAGLAIAVIALSGVALPGTAAVLARGVAAVGLTVLAWTAGVVCLPVLRAMVRAGPAAPRWLVAGVAVWLPVVVWADVLVVLTGAWAVLDAVGVAVLAGVLGPAILATVSHLAPAIRGRHPAARDQVRARVAAGAALRAGLLHAGVAVVVVANLPVVAVPWLAVVGWVAAATGVLATVAAVVWPVSVRGARP